MFKKVKCQKCGRKIKEGYSFCPHCGNRADFENEDDLGMLGKSDIINGTEIKLPAGFNSLFNSMMGNLSRELNQDLGKRFIDEGNSKKIKKNGLSISISTFGDGPPKIRVNGINPEKTKEKSTPKMKSVHFDSEKVKKFTELHKEEPKTNVKRLSNKVIYELEMPEVKSREDISILKLENSIEIKAIGKNKAYSKRIPVNLPLLSYDFSEGKLTLELGLKN
jgi:RNA polymerase subunit RPABC4/transcription elongation factor Spt4